MKAVILSDLHFANPKLDLGEQLRCMRLYINDIYDDLVTSDFCIISGDLFDRLMVIGNNTEEIISFFKQLDEIFVEHSIKFIVLEGTLSHDYHQFRTFSKLFLCDVYYSEDIEIITTKDKNNNDVSFLMIPDSLDLSMEEYKDETIRVIAEHGKNVDIAIMHGMMRHHIGHLDMDVYDQDYFSSIAGTVFIGHNHGYNKYKNIYTPGSLFRDRFGEESPKGGLLYVNGKVTRLINKYAKKYVYIDMVKYKTMKDLTSVLTNLGSKTKFSLVGNIAKEVELEIKARLPNYDIRFKPKKEEVKIERKITLAKPITLDNIRNYLKIDNKKGELELDIILEPYYNSTKHERGETNETKDFKRN